MHTSADGKITFTLPDGRPFPDVPAPPTLQGDCIDHLLVTHQELGLDINAWTATPPWHGERMDLDYTIRGLRAL
jgi:hypothetical protein